MQQLASRTLSACIEDVARQLGDTPAVCRSSYIHPAAIQCSTDGQLADRLAAGDPEAALLEVLDTLRDGAARAA